MPPFGSSRTHVIGAGLAGLAAALALTDSGASVVLHEAAAFAGGRCRSYDDRELGVRLDNGNHLLLSGNRAAFAFLDRLGTRHTLAGPPDPDFPFVDLRSGERWTVRLNRGRLPWWAIAPGRRVPGTTLSDLLRPIRLARAPADATVAGILAPAGNAPGALYAKLIEPLAIAALNTPTEAASARLLWAVLSETLARGGAACVPSFPAEGLSESFVLPALAALTKAGADIRFGSRINALTITDDRVSGLSGGVALSGADCVILAVPAPAAVALLPGLTAPDEFQAILNLHYRISLPPPPSGFIGLIGGLAEWVFVKPGVVSVTISAANRLADRDADALATTLWGEICLALSLGPIAMPPWRILREKRASFAATPAQERRRPGARTRLANLSLAGDWTATGLPATIEGAIRSGRVAAATLCGQFHDALQRKGASGH